MTDPYRSVDFQPVPTPAPPHAPPTPTIVDNVAAPRRATDRLADELEGMSARLLGITNELRNLP